MTDKKNVLNPYGFAIRLVQQRLAWDIDPESWRSRRRLVDLANRHLGEKAVILCNGPSLLKSDLALLSNCFTFGLNKINLLLEQRSLHLSCIVAVNPFVIEQNADYYNQTDVPLFLDRHARGFVKSRPGVVFLHSAGVRHFAEDVSVSLYQGSTVTFVALQLAFHMGFAEVALIGADHNYAVKGPANQQVSAGARDESHFDPRYFSDGMQWQLPDLIQSEVSYLLAREAFERHRRRIVNCTVGGRLDIFPREDLAAFVGSTVASATDSPG
jgi:6-hydroxymethylpterin diphosphokinase MptE-like protein